MLRSLAMVSWLVFRSTTACNMCTILFVPIVLIQSLCNLYWILQVVFNQVPRKSIYAFYNKYEKLVTGSSYSLLSLLVTPIVTMSYVMCETGFPGNISAKWGKCDIWEVEKFTFDLMLRFVRFDTCVDCDHWRSEWVGLPLTPYSHFEVNMRFQKVILQICQHSHS